MSETGETPGGGPVAGGAADVAAQGAARAGEAVPARAAGLLPPVRTVGMGAPFRWLAGGWSDLRKAWIPCLIYGGVLAGLSFLTSLVLVLTDASFLALVLTCGFVFIAPMLGMGLYEAGRLIEKGETPTLPRMAFVKRAFSQDVAYLGLFLLLIYLLWGRIAQLVYGLSTWNLHDSVSKFVTFALTTSEGHTMLMTGSLIGGVIAFFTYMIVVVAAPMLMDRQTNVFAATVTSFTAVAANPLPMALWAVLIVLLLLASAATAFALLVIVFPLLGLASWRAYRDLVG